MKNLFLLLSLLVCGKAVIAQNHQIRSENQQPVTLSPFSAGLRTGAIGWKDIGNKSGTQFSWTREVFFRARWNQHIVFDAGLSFDHLTVQGRPRAGGDAQGYYHTGFEERLQHVGLNLSMEYEVTCSYLRNTPGLQGLRSYIGLSASPTVTMTTSELSYRKIGEDHINTRLNTKDALIFWTGVNQTFEYNLNRNWKLVTMARLEIDPYRIFENNTGLSTTPDSRFGLSVGVGYQF